MISIIVSHHSGRELLDYCLGTLYRTVPADVEIIVVANNADSQERLLDLEDDRITLIRKPRALGSFGAVKVGVEQARGAILVFVDNDTAFPDGWLEPLIARLNSAPRIAAVSAKLVNPWTGRIVDYGIAFTRCNAPHPFFDRSFDFPLTRRDRRVQAACSAVMAVRRDAFELVKGATIDGTAYYNDIRMCLEWRRLGWEVWVSGTSVCFHKSSYPGANAKAYKGSAQKSDQKALFYSDYADLIERDMSGFFDEAFDHFLNSAQPAPGYQLLDMSSILDRDDHIGAIASRFRIFSAAEMPIYERDCPHINLLSKLGHDLARSRTPLLYFVDRFSALESNALWFALRNDRRDLVIDRNANVLHAHEIDQPSGPTFPPLEF